MIQVSELIKDFTNKRIYNSKINANAVSDYLKQVLKIKTYIPFREKRAIAEMVVAQNLREIDGIKKYDNIDSYISLIVASIAAHTDIEFSADPVADYDMLAESGLLPQIIAEFQESHEEISVLLKMALAMELEDNSVSALIGHFLDKIIKMLDGVSGALKDKFADFGLDDINEEDLARLTGLLDKLK